MDEIRIQEIAKDICNYFGRHFGYTACGDCFGEQDNYCGCRSLAESLYITERRRQAAAVRELFEKLNGDWVEVETKEYGKFYAVSEERLLELVEEYEKQAEKTLQEGNNGDTV